MRDYRIHISYQLGTSNEHDLRLQQIDKELNNMLDTDPRRLKLFKEQDEIVKCRKKRIKR